MCSPEETYTMFLRRSADFDTIVITPAEGEGSFCEGVEIELELRRNGETGGLTASGRIGSCFFSGMDFWLESDVVRGSLSLSRDRWVAGDRLDIQFDLSTTLDGLEKVPITVQGQGSCAVR